MPEGVIVDRIRIFISSLGDIADERRRAAKPIVSETVVHDSAHHRTKRACKDYILDEPLFYEQHLPPGG